MESLQDKTIFITGASSGIGRATALRLASHGAHIALSARNRDALEEVRAAITASGGKALVVPADVTVADDVRRAIDEAAAHFGKLDVLIASAGLSMRAYFDGSSLEALERVMR